MLASASSRRLREHGRQLLAEVLHALGHRVEEAATGRAAITHMEQQAYDLIALDLRLPDMNGKEVWHWILSHDPTFASRMVFVTGDTMSPENEGFLREAGRPVLTKPMTVEQIQRVVDEVLLAQASATRG